MVPVALQEDDGGPCDALLRFLPAHRSLNFFDFAFLRDGRVLITLLQGFEDAGPCPARLPGILRLPIPDLERGLRSRITVPGVDRGAGAAVVDRELPTPWALN